MIEYKPDMDFQTWIPHEIAWATLPDCFAVAVPIDSEGLVEFIARGQLDVTIWRPKKAALVMSVLNGDCLQSQFALAAWDKRRLKPLSADIREKNHIKVYFHGAFDLPGADKILVMAGRQPMPEPQSWVSRDVKSKAQALYSAHLSAMADFNDRVRCREESDEDLYEKEPALRQFEGLGPQESPPTVGAGPLVPLLSKAVIFSASASLSYESLWRRATRSVKASGWSPPRDGGYTGIRSILIGEKRHCIVTWVPYRGGPSYPELRYAVQRRLPHALRQPRLVDGVPPRFDTSIDSSAQENEGVLGVDSDENEWLEVLEEIILDDRDFRVSVDRSLAERQAMGFEAIAWYQPFHKFTEETWGIYIDAQRLDEFALALLDDFRAHRIYASPAVAAQLAFGLVYVHELFHARVEASLSWMEINALQPRHLRYNRRVYQALRETPEWLEEALANWASWSWFVSDSIQAFFGRALKNVDDLEKVVQASLDLSPAGYREWRLGHKPSTWRVFTTQLTTGRPKPPSIALPLESVLNGSLPYDFRGSDIPLRFIGSGAIADCLRSTPAIFNVPARRELEKALIHTGHTLNAAGGKGGHQKWTGPDRRAFILPRRDPVGRKVFNSFLHHLGIDKETYVRELRPAL